VGSRRLLSVVLSADSENTRANESQKLLNWGYTAFEAVKLFDANQAVVTPAVWKGKLPTVALGQSQSIVVAVPAGMGAKLTTEVSRPDPLVAPFTKGQQLGVLKVSSAGQLVAEVPLQALQAVEQAGVLGRAWDALRLWIK
jgi:D-alanyl-D-alanine carboxypeptidase (penicillin-binding protein 5/6)